MTTNKPPIVAPITAGRLLLFFGGDDNGGDGGGDAWNVGTGGAGDAWNVGTGGAGDAWNVGTGGAGDDTWMPLTQATRKTPAIGNISDDSAMLNSSF